MLIRERALALRQFFSSIPGVHACSIVGSLAGGSYDAYSDIDLEVDVSGMDNAMFALAVPELLQRRYSLLYADYAPSLVPQKYVVTAVLFPDYPFMTADISCVATPHFASVSRAELSARNNLYTHTCKVFTINLKHMLRGVPCRRDVERMYMRFLGPDASPCEEWEMMRQTLSKLRADAEPPYKILLSKLEAYMP